MTARPIPRPRACGRRVASIVLALASHAGALTAAPPCPDTDCDPSILARRTLTASRIVGTPPVIDGRLDDPAWAEAAVARDFVERTPRPAAPASLRSEARVAVDERALYVALRYDDPDPARILAPLVRRDDEITSDWAFVEIDSRHDRRTGFSFGVNPRGVQADGIWLGDTGYDSSWNGVWESAARVDARGWTAEFRIPFSQLPFSLPAGAEELVWGINFYRYSPSHGESSNWSPRYPGLGGIVSNFNDLRLPAPGRVTRLDLTPYLAPRVGNAGGQGAAAAFSAGADVRVGLGSSFTLTGTLLPDFGQVESDPSQVNLTAFELFQPERRPFFLEGLDLFRFDTSLPFASRGVSLADESPFYSRRVGRAPRGPIPSGATLESMPAETAVLGAVKLSGQTQSGWTLGVFTATTDSEQARVRGLDGSTFGWPVEPRSALTVARAVRSLRGGESSLGLFAADLHRFRFGPTLAALEVGESAAAGLEGSHRFGHRLYEARAWILASRLTGDPAAIRRVAESPHHYFQRPDAASRHDASYGRRLEGMAAQMRVSRVGGALHWDLFAHAVSPGFDVNEIGFQRQSDWLFAGAAWRYERARPGRAVRGFSLGSRNLGLGWSWAGEPRARAADGYASLDFGNYWSLGFTGTHEMSALSTDWLRGGPALRLPPRDSLAVSIRTDQRKASYASLDATSSREPQSGSWAFSLDPFLNIRSTDRLQWSFGPSYRRDVIGWQPLGRFVTDTSSSEVVARVRQETLAFTARADLTFSRHLVLQLYAQPFVTIGRHDRYQRLIAPRDPDPGQRFAPLAASQAGLDPASLAAADAQQRSLNGTALVRWECRPGSFLTLVWNHRRDATTDDVLRSPGEALGRLWADRPVNALLLKMSLRLGS